MTTEELKELAEEVKDSMAFRLKEEWGFEVENSSFDVDEREDVLIADVKFKGRFSGDVYPFQTPKIVEDILKGEPYRNVAIVLNNIHHIDINNFHYNEVTIRTTEEEENNVWGWNGCDYYPLEDTEEDKKEKEEVKKIIERYKGLLVFYLQNWTENIRKEYIIEYNKRYWTQRLDTWCEDCRNGKQFN